jgi:Peptidase A4 family
MSKLIRKFRVPLALTATAIVVVGVVASVSASPKKSWWSPARGVKAHRVYGCGAPITVYAPRRPGAPLNGRALGVPDGPGTVIGLANAHHARWLDTVKCRPRPRRIGSIPSPNWSGWQSNTSNKPNYVQAAWRIRGVGNANGAGNTDYSSFWVGLGGGTSKCCDELVQDGTEQDVYDTGLNQHRTYYFWLEHYPGEPQEEITNLAAHAWDNVDALVQSNSSHSAYFAMCDTTDNKCGYLTQRTPGPNGHEAEWVVERTCVGNRLPYLAPFGTMTFHNAEYDNPLRKIHQSASQTQIWMQGPHGQRLTTTSSVASSGTRFSVKWDQYGNTGPGC